MTINSSARLAVTPPPISALPVASPRLTMAPAIIGGVVISGAVVESLLATGIVVLGTAVLWTASTELAKAITDAVQEYGIPYATDKLIQLRSALQIAYQEGSRQFGAGTARAYQFMLDTVKQWIRGGPNVPVIPNQTKTIPSPTPQVESIQIKPATFSGPNELANQIRGSNPRAYKLYEAVRQLDLWLRNGKGESIGAKRTATGKQLLELFSSMRVGGQPIALSVMTPQGIVNFQVVRASTNTLAITSGAETLHVEIKGNGLDFADTSRVIEAILEANGQFGRRPAPPRKVLPVAPIPIIPSSSIPVISVTPLPTVPTAAASSAQLNGQLLSSIKTVNQRDLAGQLKQTDLLALNRANELISANASIVVKGKKIKARDYLNSGGTIRANTNVGIAKIGERYWVFTPQKGGPQAYVGSSVSFDSVGGKLNLQPDLVPAPTKAKPRPGPITTSPAPGGLPPNKDPKNTPPAFNRATVFAAAFTELMKLVSGTKNAAETDRAIEKWADKIGWMIEQQEIDKYRSGRTTGRTGRESQRLLAALDAIDRMRVRAGTGGASSMTYDPARSADFILEREARYGKDLGISIAFARELRKVLEQAITGLSSDDPAASRLRKALRHLIDHEVLLQTKNTKLDALMQVINSQKLAGRSVATLESLYYKMSARAPSSDLSPAQRKAYLTALDKLLKEMKSRGAVPRGEASLNPSVYLSATGGELSSQQLRRIDQMLDAGISESSIVSNLQGGWRPASAGVPQGKPTAEDQRLLFSARSSPEIVNSQVLDPRVGKTLVVVSESSRAQYEKIFANQPSVVVVAAFNKDEDPVNSLVARGVMADVKRIIAVGGAGQIDVAKGLTNHFSQDISGDLVVVPTVLSTTTLATPFVVTGVAANVSKAFSATTVVVPMKEMINDILNIKDPVLRKRAFKAFAFNFGGGGGDLQGSISIQLQNLYYKPVSGKTALEVLAEDKYAKSAIALNKKLVTSFPDIAKNDATTLGVISRKETEAQIGNSLVEIANQLFEYGNKATGAEPNPIEYLNDVVGAEHEFFNATNDTPLGKAANHGELVAMGTLMQARAYGELTKDFSVYDSLVAAYQKLGIPTTAADLASRGITVDEISVALAKSIAKNRLGDAIPNNLGGATRSLVSVWNTTYSSGINEAARYKQLIENTFR